MRDIASYLFVGLSAVFSMTAGTIGAEVIFTDDFDSGASVLWGNEVGSWTASGGEYYAQSLLDNLTYSSLPWQLTDFAIDVDINHVLDGGIWLRSLDNQNGVMLVTGGYGAGQGSGDPRAGTALYWHVVQNGGDWSQLNPVVDVFEPGVSNPHVRVEVQGDTYLAYVDGQLKTTLTTDAFPSGCIALYDFSSSYQTFDNVVVSTIAEPSTIVLFGIGAVSMFGYTSLWRRRRACVLPFLS